MLLQLQENHHPVRVCDLQYNTFCEHSLSQTQVFPFQKGVFCISYYFTQNKISFSQSPSIFDRSYFSLVNKILFHSAIFGCKALLGFARKYNTHEASDDTRYGSDKSLPNTHHLLLYLYPNSHFRTPSSSQGLNLRADKHTAQSVVFGRPCEIRSARSFRLVFFLKTVFYFEILIFEEDFY